MIKYKTEEEKGIAIHYAELLDDNDALSILEKGSVENSDEARKLAAFYWNMVNKTVEEDKNGIKREFENIDMWLEYLCNAFYIYLSNEGYESEWEEN
jgi:Neuraminidase (sialidase)